MVTMSFCVHNFGSKGIKLAGESHEAQVEEVNFENFFVVNIRFLIDLRQWKWEFGFTL